MRMKDQTAGLANTGLENSGPTPDDRAGNTELEFGCKLAKPTPHCITNFIHRIVTVYATCTVTNHRHKFSQFNTQRFSTKPIGS